MKLSNASSTSTYYNYYNNPYVFYLLNEKEFEDLISSMKSGEQENICFCGKIVDYDLNENNGWVEYEGKRMNVNFNRIGHSLQLNNNVTNGMFFIYGFLMKEDKGVKVICNFYRQVSNFNNEEYKTIVKNRREIMKECLELKEQNDFWYASNSSFSYNNTTNKSNK